MMATMQTQGNQSTKNVMGLFRPETNFQSMFNELQQSGYTADDYSVIMSEHTRNQHFNSSGADQPEVTTQLNNKAPEGFTTGAMVGGALGALIGGLTLVGSLVVPGSQLLLFGPAVGALTGLATGAAAGGLIGALVGMGIPEIEAKFYQDAVDKDENILVVVNSRLDDANRIEDLFKRYDARRTNQHG